MSIDITLADIEKKLPESRLIELTDDANDVDHKGTVNEAVVDEAIADAYDEMWPYLSVRYDTPIEPTPDELKPSLIAVAIKNLFSRVVEEMPPSRKDAYNAAVQFWKDISRGLAKITIPSAPEPTSSDEVTNQTSSTDRIFTKDNMQGY